VGCFYCLYAGISS